ncbi:MAG: hypothetical protein K6T87_04340 [Roseiflexus sp.]|uniref:hypothetical protein n=1 Tax=Roseiflexus sp. TaxID=2562120 RepID=UPI0025CE8DAB|nr:hypothetical protein [Roseiflexus sp.]MCL6539810.1 hypothetical protein [Roseiflexus sp.]
MSKLILATGMEDFDQALEARYKAQYTVQTVSYLQGLTVLGLGQGDTVVLTRVLPDSGAGDEGFVAVIEHLRRYGVRVVFLDQSRPKGDPLVSALVHRGVYDLLLADELVLEQVFDRIDHPATYGDVEALLVEEDRLGKGSGSRRLLTWRRQQPAESAEDERTESTESESSKERTRSKRPALRLSLRLPEWHSVREANPPSEPEGARLITVSGLPGSGVTFVALHLARAFSRTQQTVLIEASDRPIIGRWLHGPADWDGANAWVRSDECLEEAWHLSDTLTLLPAQSSGPSLAAVRKATRHLHDETIVVVDARLSDLVNDVDVLVVPPDPEKISYVFHLTPRVLVVNMTPERLPVDPAEYAGAWTNVEIITVPYVPEQSVAVISGELLNEIEQILAVASRWL